MYLARSHKPSTSLPVKEVKTLQEKTTISKHKTVPQVLQLECKAKYQITIEKSMDW